MTADSPLQVLQSQFGFNEFREGQERVIARLLAGQSVLAIFPTGAGKSICYQLPALMLEGITLVISPLIALMKDQIDFLQSKGVAAERLDSTLDLEQYKQVMNGLTSGGLKLLYVAPERLGSERFLQTLKRLKIAMLAIDEAHCISEWGHNFRPDYMKLATLAKTLGVQRVLGLTATATPSVASDIARAFDIAPDDVVKTPFHRKNLVLRVTPVAEAHAPARNKLLLERIGSRPPGPTIVYVTLQKTAEDVAAFLASQNLQALAYHAGMNAFDRHAVQDQFMASDRAIVVATIAFGMGIDKRDIRYVYHYNLPKSLESYAQEIGRAGRDGNESTCETLACAQDRIVLENFTYGDTPTGRSLYELLQSLFNGQLTTDNEPTFDISTYTLSADHDIRPLVIDTVLTYLQLDGIIASTGPFYNEYKFQPLRPSTEMLARFDADRQAFLRAILKCAQQGKTWFKLDLEHVMQFTGAPRARIVAALNYLEEQGDMKLEVAGARQGYRMLRKDFDLKQLAQTMVDRFAHREKRDIERLGTVLKYVSANTCRTGYLLNYFGEPLEGTCGHCDVCQNQFAGAMQDITTREIDPAEQSAIVSLKSERHPALSTPRQMARFLCGLNSPATTKAKLRSHPAFAMLEGVPFETILSALKG
jgi:ATP-dependent DNA helicase RecQ